MTVRHLQSLHQQRSGGSKPPAAMAAMATTVTDGSTTDPSSSSSSAALTAAVVQKFQTGYQECAGEVNRFVGRLDGIDEDIKKRLMSHLDLCVAKMRCVAAASSTSTPVFVNNYHPLQQQPYDPAAAVHLMSANGRMQLLHGPPATAGPGPPLRPHQPPSVGGHLRAASAFTAVHNHQSSSSTDVDRSPYRVYCDEPAVSSTSSWAEDAAATKCPPLDFSMKKNIAACANKKPLGDIPVNVPTAAASDATVAAVAAATHKTASTVPGSDGPPAIPVQMPVVPAPPRPQDGSGSDPNMWRPW